MDWRHCLPRCICQAEAQLISGTSRVPTRTGKPGKPGRMGRHFPVREKSGNFVSPEKWEPWPALRIFVEFQNSPIIICETQITKIVTLIIFRCAMLQSCSIFFDRLSSRLWAPIWSTFDNYTYFPRVVHQISTVPKR